MRAHRSFGCHRMQALKEDLLPSRSSPKMISAFSHSWTRWLYLFLTIFSICGSTWATDSSQLDQHQKTKKMRETVGETSSVESSDDDTLQKFIGSVAGFPVNYAKDNPIAAPMPKPFQHKNDTAKKGQEAFMIAGANCDTVLKREDLTITGIPIKELEKRAWPQKGYSYASKLSSEGFIPKTPPCNGSS